MTETRLSPIEAMFIAFKASKKIGPAAMEDALLALAECDFYVREQIIGEVAEINGEVVMVDTIVSPYASICVFRNLLQSIASQEK